ncbi:MAG: AraC family transcriptional regulator [Clostridia bacterium]|nr:AraC family transcriptional regulator [Clostridia bacterium]MBR6809018.1 AraC family transcriptional regulator [Clostridia bacterium]
MNDIIFAGKHFLTYSVSRHKHDSWELVYCTRDCGTFVFDALRISYGVGDIVVIPPGIPHENVSETGFTNIHLNISDASLPFREPVVIHDDANHSILHLFSDSYYHYNSDQERRTLLLPAYGNLIAKSITANQSAHPKNKVAEEIERSIVQNYANANYELDAFLHTLPYCYDHLCKIFRKELGMTPHKYLTNLRLQAAAELLCSAHNSGNITEVSLLCGFKNPLYFSRLFKKKYDVSPKEYYRRKLEAKQLRDMDSDSQKIILED